MTAARTDTVNLAEALFGPAKLERFGERDAVVCEGRRLSYRALAALADRMGQALLAAGLGRGERVLFVMRDTPELLAGYFGAMKCGAVPVALSPRATAADLAHAVRESGARLLVHDALLEHFAEAARGLPVTPLPATDLATAADADGELRAVSPDPDDEAFWVYSSGSTGRGKGVVHRHRDLDPVTRYHRQELAAGPGDIFFCTSRLSFAYTLGNAVLAPLYLGATILQQPDWPSAESSLALIRAARPNLVFSIPSLYRAWLAMPAGEVAALGGLRHFLSAGEPLPPLLLERWRALTGKTILDCYGCSETVFFVFAGPAKAPRPGSAGRAAPGVEVELRAAHGGALAAGATGRLFLRHPFLAKGYGPLSRHHQRRFADGWFETGDLFRRDPEGYWTHSGRDDDLLKIAGQWVNLRELEEVAAAAEDVALAAAVSATDPDGLERIALFVTPEPRVAAGLLAERLESFLSDRLPAHKRPKWLKVIAEMPLTTTGKVRKVALRRVLRGGQP